MPSISRCPALYHVLDHAHASSDRRLHPFRLSRCTTSETLLLPLANISEEGVSPIAYKTPRGVTRSSSSSQPPVSSSLPPVPGDLFSLSSSFSSKDSPTPPSQGPTPTDVGPCGSLVGRNLSGDLLLPSTGSCRWGVTRSQKLLLGGPDPKRESPGALHCQRGEREERCKAV